MIRLLTVCTGNICRSPLAERMLQSELDQIAPGIFSVTSAGVGALVGRGMEEESAELLTSLGGNPEGFTARQLTPQILAEMDIVLTMTVDHRNAVIRMSPRMLKRCYTLVEFARILRTMKRDKNSGIPGGGSFEDAQQRWASFPQIASKYRSDPTAVGTADDVVDPYRKSSAVHQQMVMEIMPAVETIVAFEQKYSHNG